MKTMNKLEIVLQKRKGKSFLYHIAGIFSIWVLTLTAKNLMVDFFWLTAVLSGAMLIFSIIILKSLFEYYTYGEVKFITESDGKTISFYNRNSQGNIFNKSKAFDLNSIGRFYIVQENTRYLSKNYSFAIEEKGAKTSFFKEDVDPFPSLFETTKDELNEVLLFVKTVAPETELGYENMFQKISKK
jgi:hypothetical protein